MPILTTCFTPLRVSSTATYMGGALQGALIGACVGLIISLFLAFWAKKRRLKAIRILEQQGMSVRWGDNYLGAYFLADEGGKWAVVQASGASSRVMEKEQFISVTLNQPSKNKSTVVIATGGGQKEIVIKVPQFRGAQSGNNAKVSQGVERFIAAMENFMAG